MRRFVGIAVASVAAAAMTLLLNVNLVAGFPWSEHMFGG
jgi:hypothetical protein